MQTFTHRLLPIVLMYCALLVLPSSALAIAPVDHTVQVSATVQTTPPQITLQWTADPNATSYTLFRKASDDTTWGVGTSLGIVANYVDTRVAVGTAYEYQIIKTALGYTGYGYMRSGIAVPLIEDRGIVELIVEQTYAADLAVELTRLELDLLGDGWQVQRHDVVGTAAVTEVKALIKADYTTAPTRVKAVLLFGHVPVPYSGDINPDAHPDHRGAWPADGYYGDMNGIWTDTTVNDTTAARSENQNIPGDGKFDQSTLPSDVELQIGRVDLTNMPVFAPKTELDLLRQYLNKDHAFRHKLISVQSRGLIDDNFGDFNGEAFASNGWRNFAPLVGSANITVADWFTTLNTQGYLWGYGCGGGNYTGAGGVGSTTQFKTIDTQVVFTMLFGSYFGDWDVQNSFLRAPLATTTYGLTSLWAGRPNWFVHPMGLGETIGYSTRLTQNNSSLYSPMNYGGRFVHVALMGDPTLRMQAVAPVRALSSTVVPSNSVQLQWTASPDAVQGYYVYRASSENGPFTRINAITVAGTVFTDTSIISGTATYMVRAVKEEITPSGSYINGSEGIFTSVTTRPPTVSIVAPLPNTAFTAPAIISVSATASDSDGKVNKVTFYAGTTNIGQTTSAPYSIVWQNVPPGKYVISAVASDNNGLTTPSVGVQVVINGTRTSLYLPLVAR